MKQIRYCITFFSDWHCGSGLSAGADVDALVIKDDCGLPFIPGKTIKGLIRDAVFDIADMSKNLSVGDDIIVRAFGSANDDAVTPTIQGALYFSNAELNQDEAFTILNKGLKNYLYHSVSMTAIGENGVAKPHSLRKIQVVVPCVLYGEIKCVPDEIYELLICALSYVKRLGLHRNRGLGRCMFTILNEGGEK